MSGRAMTVRRNNFWGGSSYASASGRRRDGLRCMTIELRETEVTALIRKRLLKEDARGPTRPCPDGFPFQRWPVMRDGAERFAQQWGTKAVGLGWTFGELFDLVEPFANHVASGSRVVRG